MQLEAKHWNVTNLLLNKLEVVFQTFYKEKYLLN